MKVEHFRLQCLFAANFLQLLVNGCIMQFLLRTYSKTNTVTRYRNVFQISQLEKPTKQPLQEEQVKPKGNQYRSSLYICRIGLHSPRLIPTKNV